MKKARQSPEPSLWREILRALALGTVPLALAIAGVWLTPLREIIANVIWSESASVVVAIPRFALQEGDEFEVQVLAQPTSPVAISPGVLEVKASNELVAPAAGDNRVEVPSIGNPAILNKANPARFIAIGSGTTRIEAVLQTRRGRYVASETIEIRPRKAAGTPSSRNYSGRWEIRLGPHSGQMEMYEQGATLNGRYSLDDATRGVLDGVRDGATFHATLYRGSSTTKWIVVAETHTSVDYIEIKGNATLYRVDSDGWRSGAGSEAFYAVARLRP